MMCDDVAAESRPVILGNRGPGSLQGSSAHVLLANPYLERRGINQVVNTEQAALIPMPNLFCQAIRS